MAFFERELGNAKLVWNTWGDRLLACAIIFAGLVFASIISAYLVPMPLEYVPQP